MLAIHLVLTAINIMVICVMTSLMQWLVMECLFAAMLMNGNLWLLMELSLLEWLVKERLCMAVINGLRWVISSGYPRPGYKWLLNTCYYQSVNNGMVINGNEWL